MLVRKASRLQVRDTCLVLLAEDSNLIQTLWIMRGYGHYSVNSAYTFKDSEAVLGVN